MMRGNTTCDSLIVWVWYAGREWYLGMSKIAGCIVNCKILDTLAWKDTYK
jgi:hypothetical protein